MLETLRYKNGVGAEAAWSKLSSELDGLSQKYGLKVEHSGEKKVKLTRSGVDGMASVTDAEVVVQLRLSFVMRLLEDRIISELNDRIPPFL